MKKYRSETSVGIFVFVGIICIVYLSIKLGNVKLFGDDYYTLTASFTKVTGLKINAPVQMYGVEVGYVTAINLDLNGEQTNGIPVAVVELQVHKSMKIDDEATASIRTSGLIGDKYVDIALGLGEESLKDGDVIFYTNPPIDLEDLIGKFAMPESVND